MIENLLKQNPEALRVFVVWEPILPSDWARPTRLVLSRIPDRRVAQYWDRGHLIAEDVRNHLPAFELHCCTSEGILWDVVALYPEGSGWDHSVPVFIDGPIYKVWSQLENKLSVLSTRVGGMKYGVL